MGCASSTPFKEDDQKGRKQVEVPQIPAAVQAAVRGTQVAGGDNTGKSAAEALKAAERDARRGVSFAGDVRDTPTKPKSPPKDDDDNSISRAVSMSRPR